MNNLELIVQSAAEAGAALALETLGVTAGEISLRRARQTYGKWFTDAVRAGRLTPCRIDDGKNGAHHFRVADILTLRTADRVRAEIQNKTL